MSRLKPFAFAFTLLLSFLCTANAQFNEYEDDNNTDSYIPVLHDNPNNHASITSLPPSIISNILDKLNPFDRPNLFSTSKEINNAGAGRIETFSTTMNITISTFRQLCYNTVASKYYFDFLFSSSRETPIPGSLHFAIGPDLLSSINCFLFVLENSKSFFPSLRDLIIVDLRVPTDSMSGDKFDAYLEELAIALGKSTVRRFEITPGVHNLQEGAVIPEIGEELHTNLMKLMSFMQKHNVEMSEIRYTEFPLLAPSEQFYSHLFQFVVSNLRPLPTDPLFEEHATDMTTFYIAPLTCSEWSFRVLQDFKMIFSATNKMKNFVLDLKRFDRSNPCENIIRNGLIKGLLPANSVNNTTGLRFITVSTPNLRNSDEQDEQAILKLFCVPSLEYISITTSVLTSSMARNFSNCLLQRAQNSQKFAPLTDIYFDLVGKSMWRSTNRPQNIRELFSMPFHDIEDIEAGMMIMLRGMYRAFFVTKGAIFSNLRSLHFALLAGRPELAQMFTKIFIPPAVKFRHYWNVTVNEENTLPPLQELRIAFVHPYNLATGLPRYRVRSGELAVTAILDALSGSARHPHWRRSPLRKFGMYEYPLTNKVADAFDIFSSSITAYQISSLTLLYAITKNAHFGLFDGPHLFYGNYFRTRELSEELLLSIVEGFPRLREVDFDNYSPLMEQPDSTRMLIRDAWVTKSLRRFNGMHSLEEFEQYCNWGSVDSVEI